MEYDNTNRGALFTNDRKETEKHPDYRGTVNVGGVEYWLSGWNKQTANGEMISIAIKAKEAKPVQKSEPKVQDDDISDQIPF